MEFINYEVAERIARIVLRRPPLNVLNIAMMEEINSAIEDATKRSDVCALCFSAEGKHFSAGVDVGEHMGDTAAKMIEVFDGMFRRLVEFSRPTVCAVQGNCLGGGCELATFCDIVIASESAKFGQPEVRVGVFPPVAAAWWPLLPSSKRAVELLLTGEIVDAKSALGAGIINRVVPDAALQEETEKTLKSLAKSSAAVLAHTKRALSVPLRQIFLKSLEEIERLYLEELMKTHDAEEGLKAFLEKRKPQWRDG